VKSAVLAGCSEVWLLALDVLGGRCCSSSFGLGWSCGRFHPNLPQIVANAVRQAFGIMVIINGACEVWIWLVGLPGRGRRSVVCRVLAELRGPWFEVWLVGLLRRLGRLLLREEIETGLELCLLRRLGRLLLREENETRLELGLRRVDRLRLRRSGAGIGREPWLLGLLGGRRSSSSMSSLRLSGGGFHTPALAHAVENRTQRCHSLVIQAGYLTSISFWPGSSPRVSFMVSMQSTAMSS